MTLPKEKPKMFGIDGKLLSLQAETVNPRRHEIR